MALTTAAVVLAAGGGSRFGGDTHKLLNPFRGKPLVSWAVDAALGAGLDETVVVTGAVELVAVLPDGVTVIHNHAWAAGQALSLRVATTYASHRAHEAVVVGLGDQPLVPSSCWTAVARGREPIVVATYDGERRNPVRLAAEVWSLLPIDGDEGARGLIQRRPDLVGAVACDGSPADVDTVEDHRTWS